MDWVKHISIELGVENELPDDGWLSTSLQSCFCNFEDNSWPWHLVEHKGHVKSFPLVFVKVKYFLTQNPTMDTPDLTVNLDIITPQKVSHQFLIEQVRGILRIARDLGKPIHINNNILDAAKAFLNIDDCPDMTKCYGSDGCPRHELFKDIVNLNTHKQLPSLFALARTTYLGTMDSIPEAFEKSGFTKDTLNLTIDENNAVGIFHCMPGRSLLTKDKYRMDPLDSSFPMCHCKDDICVMQKAIHYENDPFTMWPCDLSIIIILRNGLARRLFTNVFAILYYDSWGLTSLGDELSFCKRVCCKYRLNYCFAVHNAKTYLDWVDNIGLSNIVS